MIITTEHGTKFEIDRNNKTWVRIDKTGDSGNLRDESGTFIEMTEPELGKSFYLTCPPRVNAAHARLIVTSKVRKIEED